MEVNNYKSTKMHSIEVIGVRTLNTQGAGVHMKPILRY